MIAHKIVALFVVDKYEVYALLCRITSVMCTTYLVAPFSLLLLEICEMGVREKWVFLTTSQGKVRE